MADDATIAAGIGHNAPPAYEAFSIHIEDLLLEARNHLDGEAIQSQAQADAIGSLLDKIRTASKDADKARAAEKKPHDDAAKAVQAKWKPLIDKCDTATDACKKALAPYLKRVEEEKRAKEEAARREAEEKARIAAEAVRQAPLDDLTAREAAEELERAAKEAEKAANKASKDGARVAGGARATTLRTYYHPELVTPSDALRHYVQTRPDDVKAFLLRLAEVDVREGKRTIPGFNVVAEERVV